MVIFRRVLGDAASSRAGGVLLEARAPRGVARGVEGWERDGGALGLRDPRRFFSASSRPLMFTITKTDIEPWCY